VEGFIRFWPVRLKLFQAWDCLVVRAFSIRTPAGFMTGCAELERENPFAEDGRRSLKPDQLLPGAKAVVSDCPALQETETCLTRDMGLASTGSAFAAWQATFL